MSDIQRRDIVAHNMPTFVEELVDAIRDGWDVSPTCPGDALLNYGCTFTVSLYRNADTVEKFRKLSENIAEKPKMTRAETLEVARKAKRERSATIDLSNVQN